MENIVVFEKLKEAVLLKYRTVFSYSDKTLADFGNKEIRELLQLIEENCKQTISEKWVYTYLKPATINKLPRKDMLDILSIWVGYSGWDEFKVKASVAQQTNFRKKRIKIGVAIIAFTVFLGSVFFLFSNKSEQQYTVCFYDQYTQAAIQENLFTAFLQSENINKLNNIENCVQIHSIQDSITIEIESPYYKNTSFIVKAEKDSISLFLQPDDYTLMLHNYMNSNIENWKKRRTQLEEIIHNDAEIIEVMKSNIGVEFLNKNEFIDKITTPIKSVAKMEIIDIKYNENNKIISLRFIQNK